MPKGKSASSKPRAKAKPTKTTPKKRTVVRDNKGHFISGQSGNPGGRSKGSRNLKNLILDEIYAALKESEESGIPLRTFVLTWLKEADAKEGAGLLRAFSSLLPKDIDVKGEFELMADVSIDAELKSLLRDPDVKAFLREVAA